MLLYFTLIPCPCSKSISYLKAENTKAPQWPTKTLSRSLSNKSTTAQKNCWCIYLFCKWKEILLPNICYICKPYYITCTLPHIVPWVLTGSIIWIALLLACNILNPWNTVLETVHSLSILKSSTCSMMSNAVRCDWWQSYVYQTFLRVISHSTNTGKYMYRYM